LKPFSGTLLNAGVTPKFPKGESDMTGSDRGYQFIKDLSSASANAVTIDFRLKAAPETGTRTHLLCPSGATVFLGQSPRVREAEGHDNLLERFMQPSFCARVDGKDLNSVFIAVHEAVKGAPRVRKVSAVPLRQGVLLTIEREKPDRDYFAMAYDGPLREDVSTPDGKFKCDGAYSLLRVRGGKVAEAHMVAGSALSLGAFRLTGSAGWRGSVAAVRQGAGDESRGAFDVSERIPPDASVGALIVEFADKSVHAYNVQRIEPLEQGTRIHVVEEPGFAPEGDRVRFTCYPQRALDGAHVTYWLPGLSHAGSGQ
jgi:hypothetical protein